MTEKSLKLVGTSTKRAQALAKYFNNILKYSDEISKSL